MPTTRWREISHSVHTDIKSGRLQPGDLLPSEQQMAAQWGVCRMTAHRAMQELQQQGLVTRRRKAGTIVAAVPADDRRNRPAQSTAAATKTVALLFFHNNDFPQVNIIHGIRATLPDSCRLLFCDTRNDAVREASQVREMAREADGIICYPTCAPANTALWQSLLEDGFPVVCVDRLPDGLNCDAVVTANEESTRAALAYLHQERGHTRIAHFTNDCLHISSVRERHAAYRALMDELGEPEPGCWERHFPAGLGHTFETMVSTLHDALFTLRHQPSPPTAIFCLEDYYMLAVLEACDTLGLRVPEDLEVLSFSDCPPALLRPARSRVHRLTQESYEIGRLAADCLLRRLADKDANLSPEKPEKEVHRIPARFHHARSLVKSDAP